MQDQTKQILDNDEARRLERAIVARIVGEGPGGHCSRAELAEELGDIAPDALTDALARLDREDVIVLEGQAVRASSATVRLDELELIAL
jgi:hypothetical protein